MLWVKIRAIDWVGISNIERVRGGNFQDNTSTAVVCKMQEKQLIHWSSVIPTFLLAVQQVFAQVSLGREGHVAEATLCNGLLLVFVVAAHFTDVFLEVRESSKQTAALVTLERSQVIMAGSDMHGDCGVVPERHATPTQEKWLKHTDEHTLHRGMNLRY